MQRHLLILLFLLIGTANCQRILPDSLLWKIENTIGINKANAYNNAGSFCVINYPDSAIGFAQKALVTGFMFNDLNAQAIAMGTMAEAYFYKSEYDSSVILYLKAIKICEKINNRRKLANYFNGLGTVFYQMGDFKKSALYMKHAADIKLADGQMVEYGIILTNLAGVLQRLGKFAESIRLLREAEHILLHTPYTGILANLYNTLGSAFQLGYHNLDSAEYYYLKNISFLNTPGLESFGLSAFTNLGELYLQKSNFEKSEFYLLKALRLSLSYQRRVETAAIYERLGELYSKKGQFKQAYIYQKQEVKLKDSIFTESNQLVIQQMETQYQTEKKDAQIKAQELAVQKRKNRENTIIFIGVVVTLVLLLMALFFVIRAKSKSQLEKAKSRMFQNIVHEIRTPLALIVGPLHLLKKQLVDKNVIEQLNLMEKNSHRLVGLVDELLIAAKLEKKEYELSYQYGDIVLFAKSLVHSFSTKAAENQIELRFESNVDEKQVKFAASALEKVIVNLISNALKYNREEGSVSTILFFNDKNIQFTVTDNGVGMAKKDKERAFERFYRGDGKKEQPGFGIGLSVVKELVELMHGTIHLETSLGVGTSMLVTIPLIALEPANIQDNEPLLLQETILVVEDDDGIYEFIKQVMATHNLQVIRGHHGKEGFEKALEFIPDMVITDIMMPLEDGVSMTLRLKQHELTHHIPVMMLSAKQSIETRLEAMGVGADLYLAKPFNPDELILLVKNTLQTLRNNRQRYEIYRVQNTEPYNERVAGNDVYLLKIVQIVDEHILDTQFSVNELSEALHISRSQLHRKITAITGFSTTHFIRIIRLEKAKDLLLSNAGNVTEIAYQCGFNSQSYFTTTFTEHFGMSPTEMVKNTP